MSSGIYEIFNTVNGKRYIGSAVSFTRRWALHRTNLSHGKHHNLHMQRSWNKYGADAFKFNILLICEKKNLLFYEQRCLDSYQPEYNSALVAGSRLGMKNSPEATAKTAAFHRGRSHTAEHSYKTGAAWRGKKVPPEIRDKISKALKGKKKPPRTPEHCANLSKTKKGQPHAPFTPEHCDNISKARLGMKFTPEHCANIAAAVHRTNLAKLSQENHHE